MRAHRAVLVGVVVWTMVAAGPVRAQIVDPPPSTSPPTTQPPTTEPPVTEPATTAPPAPTTARPRSSTTRPTTTVVATTTTIRLLPPPSVAPQDPTAAPVGSKQSDHISSFFVWLSVLGFLLVIALLAAQWFLTRPGRRGWTL